MLVLKSVVCSFVICMLPVVSLAQPTGKPASPQFNYAVQKKKVGNKLVIVPLKVIKHNPKKEKNNESKN